MITPERFRTPEQGMLTLLGNPTEAVTIDRVAQAKAWKKACRNFAAAGLHLFFPHLPVTDCWKGDKHYDFAPMDAVIGRTLESDPEAQLLLRLRLHTPQWWIAQHPDQMLLYADGTDSVKVHWGMEVKTPSLASTLWRRDVEELLRALVEHVQRSDYADRVIGYHPALLHGGEWLEEGCMYGKQADYSPVMEAAFRKWLGEKYPEEEFPEKVIPTAEERDRGDIGHLRDPERSRRIIDYYEFYNNQFVEQAEGYGRAIKEATNGKAITGLYYGYSLVMSSNGISGWGHTSGHLALKRLLESPYLDYVGSMMEYRYRGPGGFGWSFGPIADSARLHGKVYVAEDEARTWLNLRYPEEFLYIVPSKTPEESVNFLKRNFACAATHGEHEELADLEGGWYDHPQIMEAIGRLAKITADPTWDRTPVSQIALFLDETGYMYQSESQDADLNAPLLADSLPEYFHLGSPIDICLFSDLTDGRAPLDRYRLVVLLNPWHLTDEQREFIKSKVQKDGRWVLSFYAPGFLGKRKPGTEHVTELIGINVKMDLQPGPLTLTSQGKTYGAKKEITPVFYADDPKAKVLARLSGSSRPALSLKRFPDWTSVYSSVPCLPAEILRRLAREAGVHLYTESDDLIYATKGLLAIHAGSDGLKRLRLPAECRFSDPFPQTREMMTARDFTVEMKKGETRLWVLKPRAE